MGNAEKVIICLPMNGIPSTVINQSRNRAVEFLERNDYSVVGDLFENGVLRVEGFENSDILKPHLYLLSRSISIMSRCDCAYFAKGWELARGCIVEHYIAKNYGLKIIYEVANPG